MTLWFALVLAASSPWQGFTATAPLELGPLNVGGPASMPTTRAAACAECHAEVARAWAGSRHKASATNALFLDGLAAEPHARCVYCHAPLAEQARALLSARREVVATRALALPTTSLVHEGITCVTCHVRDGAVLTSSSDAMPYAHALTRSPLMSESAFCAGCHEFEAHELVDGVERLTGEPLQTTFSEWRRYAAAGGEGTCQSCHMPGGSHAFVKGAHDVTALKEALDVRVVARVPRAGDARDLVLASRGVGHSYPSGDLFRHLTVTIDGVERARFGKRFEVVRGEGGLPRKRMSGDTSLVPGVPARVPIPRGARQIVVDYHYADTRHEVAGLLPIDTLVVTLVTLDLAGPGPAR